VAERESVVLIKTYFIQSVCGGPIKIGHSRNPAKRVKVLSASSPVALRVVGVIQGNQEEVLHRRFRQFRLHNEWFKVHNELVDYIISKSEVPMGAVPELRALRFPSKPIVRVREQQMPPMMRLLQAKIACRSQPRERKSAD